MRESPTHAVAELADLGGATPVTGHVAELQQRMPKVWDSVEA